MTGKLQEKLQEKSETKKIYLLLHNIRSAHNVGSMFRTADALAVSGIFLSGYTPAPTDRFGRPVKEIIKTALGAELTIPWKKAKNPAIFIREIKNKGGEIVGVEQDSRAIDYKQYSPQDLSGPVLIIMGNEVLGMSGSLKDKCDVLVEIPMRGVKESLNVSVALGVALFGLFDR